MAGSYKYTPVVAALLLFFTMTVVDPAPVSVNNFPNPTACQPTQLLGNTTGGGGLGYSCTVTPENKQAVLNDIRSDHIVSLFIDITEKCLEFVFENESFSKDLESLTIHTVFPMLISSGAFRGSERINQLALYDKYYLEAIETNIATDTPWPSNNETISRMDTPWTFLQLEPGWLMPLTRLTQLILGSNHIESFPDMQFCHLKELNQLDISSNGINTPEELGITCNTSKGPCTPCLPNLVDLSINNNPITSLNINISYNLPHLKVLDLSGCSLASIDLGAVLSNYTEVLAVSHNEISSIINSDERFCNQSHLRYLIIDNNRLCTLPAGLFGCVNHLTDLDLSKNLLSEDSLITAGLNNLTELTTLVLSYNNISTLSADLVGDLASLYKFYCSGCGLRNIEENTFINLQNLQWLELDGNQLLSIDGSTFTYLYSLYQLNMSNNLLVALPDFSRPIPLLRELILDGNSISEIDPERLSSVAYRLSILSLAFNQIRTIPDNALSYMHYLEELNLNNNKLKALNYNKDYSRFRVQTLRLSNNSFTAIPSLVQKLNYLKTVDLSWNKIRLVKLAKSDALETIDLSFNSITKFVSPLSDFKYLLWINLTNNNLREISEDVFLTYMTPRPKVFLEGNPFHCDCHMEWLLSTKFSRPYEEKLGRKFHDTKDIQLTTNDIEDRTWFYAEVPDLDLLNCQTSGGGCNMTLFTKTDFVCPYQDECTDWGCYEDCCTQNPNCPCKGVCYPECSCYHKNNHKVDFMNCTSRNITNLTHKGPFYAKQIYLDGNNLTYLSSEYLDFPQLRELFLNKSNVLNIHEGTFQKMGMLRSLHLEQNHLKKIDSNMFRHVLTLNELYLQENNIYSIENESFLDLLYLKSLKLHGNNLRYLNFTLIEGLKLLTELTLHENPWFCDCDIGPVFQTWLIKHYQIVEDIEQIQCWNDTIYTHDWGNEVSGLKFKGTSTENITTNLMNTPLIHIDFLKICTKVPTEYIKSITEVTTLAVAFVIFMLIVIAVYKNLLLIKVCLYNRCGVRFHGEERDNLERPYDVFLTYPRQDEEFVVQHLLPELEVGDNSYRICLEGRDWPPGADKCETIIASVQQSKRTILLVSEHHFNTQWCEFSFEAGHYQVLMDKQIRIIIILTDRNLLARMNRTMKMYMRTNASLVLGEKWFWKKLRYYLADNPRGADNEVGREFGLMKVYNNQQH